MNTTTIANFSFGTLPEEVLKSIFMDGRHSSRLMEHHFATILGLKLTPNDSKYDLVDDCGMFFECKSFTKNGCDFRPSMHKGERHTIGYAKSAGLLSEHKAAQQTDLVTRVNGAFYIVYDLTAFPTINYIVVAGALLLATFPTGKISKGNQHLLWGLA